MATPIEMPKLGNEIEECLLARWRKQPGETVSAGDVLADIETDKASFELTAPADGTLLAVFFKDGDLVPVYTTVGVVGTPGEPIDQFTPQAPQPVPEPPARHAGGILDAGPSRGRLRAGRVRSRDEPEGTALRGRTRLLPERRGRVRSGRQDSRGGSEPALLSRAAAGCPSISPSRLRGTIARRMRQSLASTAQYTLNASAVAAGLLSLRARIKSEGSAEDASAVNINAMVLFCAIKALEAVPEVNVEFLDGTIYQHSSIHIGFACDTPRGLLVPVIRDSQQSDAAAACGSDQEADRRGDRGIARAGRSHRGDIHRQQPGDLRD